MCSVNVADRSKKTKFISVIFSFDMSATLNDMKPNIPKRINVFPFGFHSLSPTIFGALSCYRMIFLGKYVSQTLGVGTDHR